MKHLVPLSHCSQTNKIVNTVKTGSFFDQQSAVMISSTPHWYLMPKFNTMETKESQQDSSKVQETKAADANPLSQSSFQYQCQKFKTMVNQMILRLNVSRIFNCDNCVHMHICELYHSTVWWPEDRDEALVYFIMSTDAEENSNACITCSMWLFVL